MKEILKESDKLNYDPIELGDLVRETEWGDLSDPPGLVVGIEEYHDDYDGSYVVLVKEIESGRIYEAKSTFLEVIQKGEKKNEESRT